MAVDRCSNAILVERLFEFGLSECIECELRIAIYGPNSAGYIRQRTNERILCVVDGAGTIDHSQFEAAIPLDTKRPITVLWIRNI